MWSLRRSGTSSIMSSSDYDSSQGSILVSSETSTVPSRLDSFSSSNGVVPCNDFNMQTSFDYDDNPVPMPTSPISSASSHDKQGVVQQGQEVPSTTNSTAGQSTGGSSEVAELESVEAERVVSPTIQKWVDESCVETERLKSAGNFSDDVAIKDGELDDEEGIPSSDFALQQALEYSLRAVSPNFARTTSLDAGFPALGDYHSQFTPTENMLLGLGFGGPDLGIPVRFLKSWREQVIKRKIMELQGLLGRSRKSPSPTGSARQYADKSPRGGESPRRKKTAEDTVCSPEKKGMQKTSQSVPSVKVAVKPSEKQLQLEKLKEMRQKLRKSATVSSFSPSSLPEPNLLFSGKDMKKKGAMSEKKYQKFRGATRGNTKDRRRKFGTRQSSLPISLETLPEEDEGRPAFLQQKSSSFDFVDKIAMSNCSSTTTSANSSKFDVNYEGTDLTVEDENHQMESSHKSHPTIVMSEPVDDPDQRLFMVHEIQKPQERGNTKETLDDKHLLAIRGIIESKDSGLGNEISNEGTPQLSPEHCSRNSKVKNGKDESVLNEHPENKEQCSDRLVPDSTQSTFFSKPFGSGKNMKTGEEEKKQSERVDLCIQVELPEIISDCDSDVEYLSAGIQTSPGLASGELSPLCCGQFTWDPSESDVNLSEASCSNERVVNVEDWSHGTPSAVVSQDQGQMESCQESLGTNHENGAQGVITSEGLRAEEDTTLHESCNVASTNNKMYSTDKSLSVKELDFFDCFNSEKRRLSRIDEVTESTLSHQSEEEKTQLSCESQLDSSSQATSTSSSSRPGSSMVLLGTDALRISDDTADAKSGVRAQSHSKKILKQIYKEMLERNVAGDLSNEKDLLHLRTSYQADRFATKLTVDETLLQAAHKLETCARDQDLGDLEEDVRAGDVKTLTEIEETEKELFPSKEITPVNVLESHPEESLQPHSKSFVCSPNDLSGSRQSRQFFSSQSFSSFTDAIKEVQRSRANSNTTSAVSDFEGDSFFSVPVDLEVFEPDPDVNFSLTGSDMNLMREVEEEDNQHNTFHNQGLTSGIFTIPDEISLEELEDSYLEDNENRRHAKDFLRGSNLGHFNKMRSTISSIESGAFFSETINDEPSLGREVFTQSLEINVSRPSSKGTVFMSHQSISLSQKYHNNGLKRSPCVLQEEQSSTVKVPFKYSSKYYFSVEDYSQYSDEDSDGILMNPVDQLSRRRQSLISAHLAARGHVFDEIIDKSGLFETESGRKGCSPLINIPREEEENTSQEVKDKQMLCCGDDNGLFGDGNVEFMVGNEQNGELEDEAMYGSGRRVSLRRSGDSDASLASSMNSSKVDNYVDVMLENALEEVRSEKSPLDGAKVPRDGKCNENGTSPNYHCKVTSKQHNQSSWKQMANGDAELDGHVKASEDQDYDNYNPDSQFNQRVDMVYKVGDGIKGIVSAEYTSKFVELHKRGQIVPETMPTLNDDNFISLKTERAGQEKISSDRIMVNGMSFHSLNNGLSVGENLDDKSPISSDEKRGVSHSSDARETNKMKSSKSLSYSEYDADNDSRNYKQYCKRAVVSEGLSESGSVNNGLRCKEVEDKLEIDRTEDSFISGDKTLRALDRSQLMPSYEELYSKAENLISNFDALIAGNK